MTKKIGNKIMGPKRKATKKKKAAKKKSTKTSSAKSKSPWHIESERRPTDKDADDYGRVLVWDGLMAMPRSFEQVDHDMLWASLPANPTQADLAKVHAVKDWGVGA